MKRYFELYPPTPATTPDLTNAKPDTDAPQTDDSADEPDVVQRDN